MLQEGKGDKNGNFTKEIHRDGMRYMVEKVITKLENELKRLKDIFQRGYELSIKHRPDEVRVNDRGRVLSGEVQGTMIIIYESKLNKARATLFHEFVEAEIITPMRMDYLRVIHNQNRTIQELLNSRKEDVVEAIAEPMLRALKGK